MYRYICSSYVVNSNKNILPLDNIITLFYTLTYLQVLSTMTELPTQYFFLVLTITLRLPSHTCSMSSRHPPFV